MAINDLSNKVILEGKMVSEFTYNHEVHGEKFYRTSVLNTKEYWGQSEIPLLVSENLIDIDTNYVENFVSVEGQFRSFNYHIDGKTQVILFVFAHEFDVLDDEWFEDVNQISLDGYICKEVKYRQTKKGKDTTDFLLAISRPYGKTDYIPCVCFGKNAKYAASFKIGTHVKVVGYIRSRKFVKKISETEFERKEIVEVLVEMMHIVKEYGIMDADLSMEADDIANFMKNVTQMIQTNRIYIPYKYLGTPVSETKKEKFMQRIQEGTGKPIVLDLNHVLKEGYGWLEAYKQLGYESVPYVTVGQDKYDKKEIIERDNYTCYICNRTLPEEKLTIDHVVPQAKGGLDIAANVKCCCKVCNNYKGEFAYSEKLVKLIQKELKLDGLIE